MIKRLRQKAITARNYLIYRQHAFWAATAKKPFPLDANANFVISMASYPARIHLVPAVFESLARQTVAPRRAYLVLSVEDYPDRMVPKPIQKLAARGVEIVWVENNPYAVKKLMPVWGRDPDCAVVTFDDDFIYSPSVLEQVKNVAAGREKCVAGYLAKALYRKGMQLGMLQRQPEGPTRSTPPEHLYFLAGCGTWYSPESLDERVTDLEAVKSLVPGRGSDIWFWAAAHAAGSDHIWVPPPHQRMWFPIPQTRKTVPRETPGRDVMEQRFQAVIDYFGIREKLLRELPDRPDL